MGRHGRIFDTAPGATMGPHYIGEVTGSSQVNILSAFRTLTDRSPIEGDYILWSDGPIRKTAIWDASNGEFSASGGNLPSAILSLFIPMTGVTDTAFALYGEYREIAADLTADYSTAVGMGNQHAAITVNTITTGGDVVVSGTAILETTGIPGSTTETLVVDDTAGQRYQTSKKWLDITGVDVSDTTDIDYDIYAIGYLDMGNLNFELIGYRCEGRSSANAADFAIRFRKIKDDGDGKMSVVLLEHIGIDSTIGNGEIVDGVRTGDDDRSYTFSVTAWPTDTMFAFKQLDFPSFFAADENIFESKEKDEGLIVDFLGEGGGISAVDHITLTLFGFFR